MKPLAIIQRYDRIILWIAVAVLVYFLFSKQCGENRVDERIAKWKRETDSLTKKVLAKAAEMKAQWVADSTAIVNARNQTAAALADKKAADKKLTETQSIVRRLSAQVLNSRIVDIKVDSVNCDSLAIAALDQSDKIDQYRKEADEVTELMNYEILIRDSMIEQEKENSGKILGYYRSQSKIVEELLKAARPRGKLLGGISILGNQNQFLSGAGVVLAYQSKGGKQYQISPKFIKVPGGTAEVFYEGSVLFTIFK